MDPGTRPRSWTSLALTLVLSLLVPACQSAMSVEDARKMATTFGRAGIITPAPRTIDDIVAALEQQQHVHCVPVPSLVPEYSSPTHGPCDHRARADEEPPSKGDDDTLTRFYYDRALAAREVGRAQQEIDDLTLAAQHGSPGASPPLWEILHNVGMAELRAGQPSRLLGYTGRSSITLDMAYLTIGYIKAAESGAALDEPPWWQRLHSESISSRRAYFFQAQATLLEANGQLREAEALYRKAISELSDDVRYARHPWLDEERGFLARTLVYQGRLLEAEDEARRAVLGALATRGRYSLHTAWMLRSLVIVLLEQGRYRDAETLARVAVDVSERARAAPESFVVADARTHLAMALELQGRSTEALTEYEAIRAGGGEQFLHRHTGYLHVLVTTGHADRVLEWLGVHGERQTASLGGADRITAEIRGALARAYASKGEVLRALEEFREAAPGLLARPPDIEDEITRPLIADHRLVVILGSYIRLLADLRGTTLARETGIDAIAEAFRLADVARGRSVQRALEAAAARAVAGNPALRDLIHREQDLRWGIRNHYELLVEPKRNVFSPTTTRRIQDVNFDLETVKAQIERDFPSYAALIDPKPLTVDQVQKLLAPGQALIATFVTPDRTFVWAIPQRGSVAFHSAAIGARELESIVATLRRGLEPRGGTLGDIPEFDVALAHRLFRMLFEPVRSAWHDAHSLLFVLHSPLDQLPPALLPTAVGLPRESGTLFSRYRHVPWLGRTHAITVLPSVAALATLRALPPGNSNRRAFVGFGDPYFSMEQATATGHERSRASTIGGRFEGGRTGTDIVALTTRSMPITFRSTPGAFDSAQLAKLPRLPETAAEIQDLARTMNADPSRDVFLGARANEKTVKTLDLAKYRVVAFATHGLAPGDLDGLTQPALALSAPDVAGVDGDGLLSMDEILSLRLNADWVVLSACSTASGRGAGSEAVSGLGLAFFYAGARALLVSNWPVETTSARILTTDLFRRQRTSLALSGAEALQQTMNWLIDHGEFVDEESGKVVFSYAHPIFWAPFTLVGDGSSDASAR